MTLDFAVIGAAKCGTTSLWEGMRHHPQIAVPPDKERPLFDSDARWGKGVDWFVRWSFGGTPPGTRRGVVSPGLMPADPDRLDVLVERVAGVTDLRLVAVLRDPVQRAVSKYRQELRAGRVVAGEDLPAYLARTAPQGPPWTGSDLVSVGEYGRILGRYLDAVPRERLLVLWTRDLDQRPAAVFAELFRFLGVEEDVTVPHPRVNIGGSARRVSSSALAELLAELDRSVFPHVRDPDPRRGFVWWLRHVWDIEPDRVAMDLDGALRHRLEQHYRADADLLHGLVGQAPPWLADWDVGTGPPR